MRTPKQGDNDRRLKKALIQYSEDFGKYLIKHYPEIRTLYETFNTDEIVDKLDLMAELKDTPYKKASRMSVRRAITKGLELTLDEETFRKYGKRHMDANRTGQGRDRGMKAAKDAGLVTWSDHYCVQDGKKVYEDDQLYGLYASGLPQRLIAQYLNETFHKEKQVRTPSAVKSQLDTYRRNNGLPSLKQIIAREAR